MAENINTFINFVKVQLKPDTRRLDDVEIEVLVDAAVNEYSLDNPKIKLADIAATDWSTDTYSLPLPTDWNPDFSSIISLERLPVEQEAEFLDPNRYSIYRTGTGDASTDYRLRLVDTPDDTDTDEIYRMSYIVEHTVDTTTSTIPGHHQNAVGYLAAAKAADSLAGAYNSLSHTAEGLALTDFSVKAAQYSEMANEFREEYKDSVGKVDISGPAAAFAVSDIDETMSFGWDFINHPSRWR